MNAYASAAHLGSACIQDWPGELTHFNDLALELFELQFGLNPAYRRFCEARGCRPAQVQSWQQIPAVPAAAFKELELSCLQPHERTNVFFSSGTTQHRPSRHFHNPASLNLYEESIVSWFIRHFITTTRARVLALTPEAECAPNSSLVHMFDTLRRALKFSTFRFAGGVDPDGNWIVHDEDAVGFLLEAAALGEPVLTLGTAFSYVHLLDHLTERQVQLALPSRSTVLETGGYKGRSRVLSKPELHSLITRNLGVPASRIVGEYGMSELSSQAYDCVPEEPSTPAVNDAVENRRFRFPPWARVQMISPETGSEVCDGEPGLIRVFDLANAYSVWAVQTEDLGVKDDHGFRLLGRASASEPRGCSWMAAGLTT